VKATSYADLNKKNEVKCNTGPSAMIRVLPPHEQNSDTKCKIKIENVKPPHRHLNMNLQAHSQEKNRREAQTASIGLLICSSKRTSECLASRWRLVRQVVKKVSFEDLAKIIRTMGPFEEEDHKGSTSWRIDGIR
jgi:UDP-3-O-[3-hydroxymyristoyl] glucosamine N-acyltransferase